MTIEDKVASLYTSAAEVRHIANLAHSIPGIFLVLAAMLILLVGFGYKKKLLTSTYAIALIVMSLGFGVYVFFGKGISNVLKVTEIVFHFPEIYIHIPMIVVTVVGSIIEILYVQGKIRTKLAVLAFPFALLVNGFINILHPHGPNHAGHDSVFHSWLGTMFVLSGIAYIIFRLLEEKSRSVFLVLGSIALIIVGGMLISYREPPTAYEYGFPQKTVTENPESFIDVGNEGIIYISSSRVTPQQIKLNKGGSVTFIQIDESVHDLASGPHPKHTNFAPLNIGMLRKGESKTVTFTTSGKFGFHDHLNDLDENLQGTIYVTDQ